MAGFWRLAQVVTGANPTVTASPNPKTIIFLNLFRTTDFSEMLSIFDLLFDKFCVCRKVVSPASIQGICQKIFINKTR